jgi:hypothetical protein|tara:strand:- start:1068 stop:1376 length:309 start_codon:yes stop_codon:yes gene_type:complete
MKNETETKVDYNWKAIDGALDEILDGAVILEPREEFHQAIIGYADSDDGSDVVAVYSVTKILDYLQKSMTYEEAQDYFDFNTARAIPYMGPRRPILVHDIVL